MAKSDKIRENRLRAAAGRQGLKLVKSRTRDPRGIDHGLYALIDLQTGGAINPALAGRWAMLLDPRGGRGIPCGRTVMPEVPCPFIYSNGRRCTGHVIRVEAYKADLTWEAGADGWAFCIGQPRSHYHVFCSEKGNHAGYKAQDDARMKFYYDQLPEELRDLISRTDRVV